MSTSPSLSMSPKAAPRPISARANAGPAAALVSSNRPLPLLRNSWFFIRYGSRTRKQPFVDKPAVAMVDPELVRRAVVGDVQIQPAVAVVVAGRDAEPVAKRSRDAGSLRDVDEPSVTVVPEQPVGHRTKGARAAVVARAGRVVAQLVGGQREVDVARDKEIEMAVAVGVDERSAG